MPAFTAAVKKPLISEREQKAKADMYVLTTKRTIYKIMKYKGV
jgi:hypothetical protein